MRLDVKPELLKWACERAGDHGATLREKIPQLEAWIQGEVKPTLKQLEHFAKAARVSIGYLFLPKPPVEKLPIPDLRTLGSKNLHRPSPDLLDAIYLCQRRQDWYREYAQLVHEDRRDFLSTATIATPVEKVAKQMRRVLDLTVESQRECPSWDAAFRMLVERAETAGILVMVSGVVGSNTTRILDPEEFRGFALADDLAPVIFINGSDTKTAQMFTFAHELAHLWLGESALSDVGNTAPKNKTEAWCNRVAAEFLVPLNAFETVVVTDDPLSELANYARIFKVSTLVILRRLLDANQITRDEFEKAYIAERNKFTSKPRAGGGNFYNTLPVRTSKRFAKALIESTLEGQTLYRDAFQMLGISNEQTFREVGRSLGYEQ